MLKGKSLVALAFLAIILLCPVQAQIGIECSSTIMTDLVKPLGYPIEEHKVTTADGYVLKMFRIQAKNTKITSDKPVVILQHGNESSSDDWVINDEDKSPGFFLANQGYDVWMTNNRGNKYCMTNTKLSRYEKSFWNFSFQEMGNSDQLAFITYIINYTGRQKVAVVGHSQGGSQYFAGLSDPISTDFLNSKIAKFVALAPVVYATQCYNKALKQFADNPLILDTCNAWGNWDLFPNSCSTGTGQQAFMAYFCTIANYMCEQFLSGGDLDPVYDNTKRLNVFFKHSPNGASVRCFQHFAQMFNEPKSNPQFRKFDFGSYENKKIYGQATAPAYDFKNIRIPVALFHGLQDTLADPGDSTILANNLKAANVQLTHYTYNQWGHLTYVWGLNPQAFFNDLLAEFKAVQF